MILRSLLFLFVFHYCITFHAQLDTLQLPFIEDFSDYKNHIPDTLKFLNQGGVYVGNGYGISPRSSNQATFDGLDSQGLPYDQISSGGNPNAINNGITDYLISKPIDLSLDNNGVIMSFWWQKGGVEADLSPELEEGDTLRLFFLDRDSSWIQVWPFNGSRTTIINTTAGSDYKVDSLLIIDNIFLHSGFQFMFEADGSRTGNYDIWSINQIYIDRARNDAYYNDFSFGGLQTPLLRTYRHMPLKQIKGHVEKELSDAVKTQIYSNSIVSNIAQDSLITVQDTISGTVLDQVKTDISTSIDGAFILNSLQKQEIVYEVDKDVISSGINALNPIDEFMVLKATISFNYSDKIKENNIQEEFTVLDNYFAYDDGTAELGFGIRETGALAVEFEMNEPDEIKSLDIHFVRSGPDNNFTSLTLKIWKKLKGVDGAEEDSVYVRTPISLIFDEFDINKYYSYTFSSPVSLPAGKFYVGYEQINYPDRLMLGCDKSVNRIDKLYTFLSSSWNQGFIDELEGAPMIRPYFGEKRIVSLAQGVLQNDINSLIAFPNPTSGLFSVNSSDYEIIEILDVNGNAVDFSHIDQEHFHIEEPGIYLIRAHTKNRTTTTKITVY